MECYSVIEKPAAPEPDPQPAAATSGGDSFFFPFFDALRSDSKAPAPIETEVMDYLKSVHPIESLLQFPWVE